MQIPYKEELFQKWLKYDSYYWNEYFKSIKVPSKYLKSGETKSEYLRGMRFPLFFKRNLNPIAMQKEFKEGLRKNIVALPGVVETLRELAQDYPIYISTNGDSKVAKEKIRRIGAEEFIISIFSADMTNPPSNKSESDYYRQLIEYIGNVTYEECLMTGDKYRDDVIMPNKIGITSGVATSYWLSSRYLYYYNRECWCFRGRRVVDGSLATDALYDYAKSFIQNKSKYAVRPIITLKKDIKIVSGDGKSASTAYELS